MRAPIRYKLWVNPVNEHPHPGLFPSLREHFAAWNPICKAGLKARMGTSGPCIANFVLFIHRKLIFYQQTSHFAPNM